MLAPVTITRLEKAATDDGFDLDVERTADWLSFGSTQTSMRIWLTAIGESQFLAAMSRADVLDGLSGLGVAFTNPVPSGAAGALSVSDVATLHRLLRRAFQLSRTLPDALLRVFQDETVNLPRATEAERSVVQRVGQDIFRRGLLEYWDGRCAITGLAVPELLRASHIKPWADCDSGHGAPRRLQRPSCWRLISMRRSTPASSRSQKTERCSSRACSLSTPGQSLDLIGFWKVRGLHRAHQRYLPSHRAKIFRTDAENVRVI